MSLSILDSKHQTVLKNILGGLADADATVDLRNDIVSYSFGSKNYKLFNKCKKAIRKIIKAIRVRRLKNEFKIEIPLTSLRKSWEIT
jgi:hypothetical protein